MISNADVFLEEQSIAQQHPDIYNSLISLLRNNPNDLDAFLEMVACNNVINATKSVAHCYFITLDGNRRPRINDFARFIGNKITDFAIPRVEILRALNEAMRTKSMASIASLNNKARHLFTKLPQSGEGGEVLLSLLAETYLQLPQLFSKMVLKTSTQMHIHGSDGIHAGVNKQNGNLAIYWGESKLYKNATQAINNCFTSLAPFLKDAGGSNASQERDLQLMRDGLSLDDQNLLKAIKQYLDPNDPMFKQLEYRGLCLVGFDSDSYPTSPNSKEIHELKLEIERAFESNKEKISQSIKRVDIQSFVIEIFCLPFPSVEDFRKAFRKELGLSNE